MPRIDQIRSWPYALPFRSTLPLSGGRRARRSGWIMELQCGDVRGFGEAAPLAPFTQETHLDAGAVLRELEESLAGRSWPEDSADLQRWVHQWQLPPTVSAALSSALADCAAQRAGLPLAGWLWGERWRDPVPSGTLLPGWQSGDPGKGHWKLKLGERPWELEREPLALLLSRLPQGSQLRLDVNERWDFSEAQQALSWLSGQPAVECVEDPCPFDSSWAQLREIGVPLVADQIVLSTAARGQVWKWADGIAVKPGFMGGVLEGRELLLQAQSEGLFAYVTTCLDSVVGRLSALHLGAAPWLRPGGLDTGGLLDEDLSSDPPSLSAAGIPLPPQPGLGCVPLGADKRWS